VETAAALIKVTPRRLQQLTAQGWIKKESRGQYTVVAVVHGYLAFRDDEERNAAKTAADSRVRDARAREMELRIAREEKELIPTVEALTFLQAVVGMLISRLIGLPAQITRDRDERRRIEAIIDDIRTDVDKEIADLQVEYRAVLDSIVDQREAEA
jgi:hypothetical protein